MKANYNAHVNNAKSETPLYTVLKLGFVKLSQNTKMHHNNGSKLLLVLYI